MLGYDELRARYPRLLRQIQWVAIMSESEAVSTLSAYLYNRDNKAGHYLLGCEACVHFGGPEEVVQAAAKLRTIGRTARLRIEASEKLYAIRPKETP